MPGRANEYDAAGVLHNDGVPVVESGIKNNFEPQCTVKLDRAIPIADADAHVIDSTNLQHGGTFKVNAHSSFIGADANIRALN